MLYFYDIHFDYISKPYIMVHTYSDQGAYEWYYGIYYGRSFILHGGSFTFFNLADIGKENIITVQLTFHVVNVQ